MSDLNMQTANITIRISSRFIRTCYD